MLIKTEGIIIRTRDYGEGNKIITLFSKDLGKVAIMARGARKPKSRLSSASQLFSYGIYLFNRSTPSAMGSLSQGEIIYSFNRLRQDLDKTAYAAYFAELVDKTMEDGERSNFLFQLLLTSYQYLEEGRDAEILARLFEMKLLIAGGYRPQVNQCAPCGSIEGDFHFSVREGGFICDKCFSQDPYKLAIQPATVKILRLLYHFDISRLGNINVKDNVKNELRETIWQFMDHHTPLRLKSRSFLEQMSKFL